MSDRIKEAFLKVKKDIDVVNVKIEKTEAKKEKIENELMVVKQKIRVEEELREELGFLIKNMNDGLKQLNPLKDEFDAKVASVEDKVVSVREENKMEIARINEKLNDIEKQITDGVMGLSESLQAALLQVQKQKVKVEEQASSELKSKLKTEMKQYKKDKKKGFISRLVNSLSDE